MSKVIGPWGMVAVASLGAAALGCDNESHEERSIGTQVHEDFASGDGSGPPSEADWHAGGLERAFVAATADGRWAIADAWSGDVRSKVEAGADASLHDVALDPWSGRLLSFEAYDDEWGEIAAYSVKAGTVGERAVLGWLEGDARLLPTPRGPVLFELAQGTRWRLMPSAGGFEASRVASLPRSVWAWQDGGDMWVEALTYGTPGHATQLEVALGEVDGQGLSAISAGTVPIPVAHGADTSARMVPVPWLGGAVLADVTVAGLSLWSLPWCAIDADCSADGAWSAPVDGQRLEQIVAMPELEVVALLTSSPSQIVAVWLPSGAGAPSVDVLPLSGEVRSEARFFSRDLLASGSDRLLAATDRGVIAVEVATTAGGVMVELDPSFAGAHLRGPLAGFPATGF